MSREAMQMALDALESLQAWPETPENFKRFRAIEALRARLAQPEPEPVAWNCAADLADASICKSWCGNSNCISHIAPSKPESEYESQPEPEPVADKYLMEVECTKCGAKQDGILTVNAPPQREWQGMTDEEAVNTLDEVLLCVDVEFLKRAARAIEAKLKEKNS